MSDPFPSHWIDLAAPRLGSRVVAVSDAFFAPGERLISPEPPVFIPGKYDDHGKWMDGWESRRRRGPGHDWLVLRLGVAGRVRGIEIDTRHFTGNFPPAASLEVAMSEAEIPEEAAWRPLLPMTALKGNDRLFREADSGAPVTHLRFNIFPDGGVARLRVRGEVAIDWTARRGERINLAALELGAVPIKANDEHFGRLQNILSPGPSANMGDGWETRRRREPGHDWGIVRLATAGTLERIVIDTAHFKGNYADRVSIQATGETDAPPEALVTQAMFWPVILAEQKLGPDGEHIFADVIEPHGPVRYLRINLVPDGGIARIRADGVVASPGNR